MLVHARCSARFNNMTFKAGFYSGQLWFNSGSFQRLNVNQDKLSDSEAQNDPMTVLFVSQK